MISGGQEGRGWEIQGGRDDLGVIVAQGMAKRKRFLENFA